VFEVGPFLHRQSKHCVHAALWWLAFRQSCPHLDFCHTHTHTHTLTHTHTYTHTLTHSHPNTLTHSHPTHTHKTKFKVTFLNTCYVYLCVQKGHSRSLLHTKVLTTNLHYATPHFPSTHPHTISCMTCSCTISHMQSKAEVLHVSLPNLLLQKHYIAKHCICKTRQHPCHSPTLFYVLLCTLFYTCNTRQHPPFRTIREYNICSALK